MKLLPQNFVPTRLRVTEESVRKEFSKFGEVVDVRGAGLFEVVREVFKTPVTEKFC